MVSFNALFLFYCWSAGRTIEMVGAVSLLSVLRTDCGR